MLPDPLDPTDRALASGPTDNGQPPAPMPGAPASSAPGPFDPAPLEDSMVNIAATIDGLTVELAGLRRKAAKNDRQMLLLYGVLAYMLFKMSGQKLPSLPKVEPTNAVS